ncbi:MAG: magnesium transporter [Opitutales bacterium]|jgi:magnesium transporter|nr:magnesium transporter [Opitutales bacterium]MDP4643389.1 magnesium transporter [Opitutales bacterium]MDP4879997.1 magnesium transporter [Opitutales bacterium]MDP4884352.1 magnesium transporter [Opitutales bacterium]MDP5079891.1 magnesium transporter [Opitutales bacterium]
MVDENTAAEIEIQELIANNQLKAVAERLKSWANPEIADLLMGLDKPHQILVYRSLPRQRAADMFAYLEPEDQDSLLEALTDADTRILLADLSPDDRTEMLEELPATVTRRLMQLLSPGDLVEVRQLLGYPEESVGRLMTPDYIRVRAEWTVEQAIDHIRKYGRDSEIFNIMYVTDGNGLLIDIVRMRRIILAAPGTVIKDILNYNCISISAFDDREVAVEMIQRYDVNALPVVDSEGVLVGIVTVDDIMDVAEEEVTEDIQKGAGMAPLETKYSAASPMQLFRKRIGWLLILIFVNLISAGVISNYEEFVMEFITLALFMPLVIASGGNCGAQAATLMVRSIATGDVELGGWMKSVSKEIFVGILLGTAMALIAAFVGQLYGGDTKIAVIVGLSMISIVFVANSFGALLPFILSRLKIDPAAASTPLITSLMDVLGLIIYFSIAVAILG